MDPLSIIQFSAVAAVLVVTPGPDLLFVLATSIEQGRRRGLVAALGFSAGVLVHTALVALGVAAFVRGHPLALTVIKAVGASYLVLLGIGAFASARRIRAQSSRDSSAGPVSGGSHLRVFVRAALANALNPKVLLFFVALLPQFIHHSETWPEWSQTLALGGIFQVLTMLGFGGVALGAGSLAERIGPSRRGEARRAVLSGTIFIGLGAWLLAV